MKNRSPCAIKTCSAPGCVIAHHGVLGLQRLTQKGNDLGIRNRVADGGNSLYAGGADFGLRILKHLDDQLSDGRAGILRSQMAEAIRYSPPQ